MIGQILPNNNKKCYSNFLSTFREVNTPYMLQALFILQLCNVFSEFSLMHSTWATISPMNTTRPYLPLHLQIAGTLMNTGPIFREVTGKFDLWRSRRWRSGFKSDTIRTLQPLHHCSVGYQPSTTWLITNMNDANNNRGFKNSVPKD
jgi:hypothetical protein